MMMSWGNVPNMLFRPVIFVASLQSCLQVRESKVRRAGIGGRARLAGELRDMDDEVSCAAVLSCVSPSNPSCLSL